MDKNMKTTMRKTPKGKTVKELHARTYLHSDGHFHTHKWVVSRDVGASKGQKGPNKENRP
jgi:hypothetical protein